jgi:hypothetical protein
MVESPKISGTWTLKKSHKNKQTENNIEQYTFLYLSTNYENLAQPPSPLLRQKSNGPPLTRARITQRAAFVLSLLSETSVLYTNKLLNVLRNVCKSDKSFPRHATGRYKVNNTTATIMPWLPCRCGQYRHFFSL